jgi:YkoY family integral membrane protein
MLAIISTILSIAILELMLSVDNALVNASLAEELPPKLQKKAIYAGIGIGAIFRIICLFLASIIIENPIIKIIGGLYLIWLAYDHFFRTKKDDKDLKKHPHFGKVIGQIAAADLVFSIDNVVGAIGISSHFAYVVFGVLIGIITMLFVTPIMLTLMSKFPTLIKTAYGIIAYVGISILIEASTHHHIPEIATFIFILVAVLATVRYDRKRLSFK